MNSSQYEEDIHTNKLFDVTFFCRFLLLLTGAAFFTAKPVGAQVSLPAFLEEQEKEITRAADAWLDKDYERAVDKLRFTADKLSTHNFPPTDMFSWEACRCVKIYTIVFSRMIECKMEEENRTGRSMDMAKQAYEWALILETQAYAWSKTKPRSEEENAIRKKWLKRFSSIVNAAKKSHKT